LQLALQGRSRGWEVFAGAASAALAHLFMESGNLSAAEAAIGPLDETRSDESLELAALLAARATLRRLQRRPTEAPAAYRSAGRLAEDVLGVFMPALVPWRTGGALA